MLHQASRAQTTAPEQYKGKQVMSDAEHARLIMRFDSLHEATMIRSARLPADLAAREAEVKATRRRVQAANDAYMKQHPNYLRQHPELLKQHPDYRTRYAKYLKAK